MKKTISQLFFFAAALALYFGGMALDVSNTFSMPSTPIFSCTITFIAGIIFTAAIKKDPENELGKQINE